MAQGKRPRLLPRATPPSVEPAGSLLARYVRGETFRESAVRRLADTLTRRHAPLRTKGAWFRRVGGGGGDGLPHAGQLTFIHVHSAPSADG